MEKVWAALRLVHLGGVKLSKFWLDSALTALYVNFGGPAGGDPTWRLDTLLCGKDIWLVGTVCLVSKQ